MVANQPADTTLAERELHASAPESMPAQERVHRILFTSFSDQAHDHLFRQPARAEAQEIVTELRLVQIPAVRSSTISRVDSHILWAKRVSSSLALNWAASALSARTSPRSASIRVEHLQPALEVVE